MRSVASVTRVRDATTSCAALLGLPDPALDDAIGPDATSVDAAEDTTIVPLDAAADATPADLDFTKPFSLGCEPNGFRCSVAVVDELAIWKRFLELGRTACGTRLGDLRFSGPIDHSGAIGFDGDDDQRAACRGPRETT